ncbi:penicillin-binding transpeptidase domain-containing protein [Bacillus cereus]|uniref:penicillin-binding transpeptidase domain-containing protein n=1 Tax=Bacillus cereus TaxID=1396 RepID=UPI000B4BECF6|nr:penicillin-binding transpeptidase domain-containing protein [Bacillus cereus]
MKKTIARTLIVVLVVFLIIAGKFAYLQLFQASELQKDTVEQRVRKVKQMPERGEIKDREGRTLAMSLNAKNIATYPNLIESEKTRKKVAKTLSETLKLPYKDIMKKLESKDKKGKPIAWASIANRVDPEKAEQLKESEVSGYIEISNAPKRYYPNGNLASTLLGFVNYENAPGAGIEMSLNHYLSGIPGYTVSEFDHSKKEIPIGFQTASKPVPGQQVTLTIDSYIQYALEQTLDKAAQEMKPKEMHAIVMDPNNGKILGMASYPHFDPNDYTAHKQEAINRNPASYVYEPGSTFKPVYMAAALDGGYINENSTWYDGTGHINIGGATIRNWNGVGLGTMTLEDIIVNSSNIGMIDISRSMTSKQTLDGLKKAGIGQKTGIELPNEEFGLIPSVKRLDGDAQAKATVSFGQGISITPIQLATSFSEVVNGGYDVKPTVVEKVEDQFGNVQYEWSQEKKKRVYKQKTSDLMRSYLKANMEKGSGKGAQIEGFDGGGKTGSAWKVENGVYKQGTIIGSFLGFVPYDNPQYVMLAVVDDPKGVEFGSQSGGPVFHEAMTEILRYTGDKRTKPANGQDKIVQAKEYNIPDVKYNLYDVAKEKIEKKMKNEVKVTKNGPGEVVVGQKYKQQKDKLYIELKTENIKGKGKTYIPDLKGVSDAEVHHLFERYNIDITSHGEGIVKYQEVKPGEYNKKINKLTIWSEKTSS